MWWQRQEVCLKLPIYIYISFRKCVPAFSTILSLVRVLTKLKYYLIVGFFVMYRINIIHRFLTLETTTLCVSVFISSKNSCFKSKRVENLGKYFPSQQISGKSSFCSTLLFCNNIKSILYNIKHNFKKLLKFTFQWWHTSKSLPWYQFLC